MTKRMHSEKINLQHDGWERQDAIGEAGSRETKQQEAEKQNNRIAIIFER
jgi:hypothetical protein